MFQKNRIILVQPQDQLRNQDQGLLQKNQDKEEKQPKRRRQTDLTQTFDEIEIGEEDLFSN